MKTTFLTGDDMGSIEQNQRGFTIVETLITTLVFSLVVIGVMGIFTQMLMIQRRGSAAQRIQENTQYVLELMAREIRVSRLAPGQNVDCVTTAKNTLTFDRQVGSGTLTVVYSLSPQGVVQRTESGATADVSSPNVKFTQLAFCVSGLGNDGIQPRVVIIAAVQDVATASDEIVRVQTLVTPRRLDTY